MTTYQRPAVEVLGTLHELTLNGPIQTSGKNYAPNSDGFYKLKKGVITPLHS